MRDDLIHAEAQRRREDKGKRKLTVEHIQKLSEFFNVSPAVFFPVNPSERDFLEVA